MVIARPGKSALKLVASNYVPAVKRTTPRILGAGVGELRVPSHEEWQAMDDEITNAPLTTDGEI